ncbi:7650_t:CDS:2, partial [Gigaspora rosea]
MFVICSVEPSYTTELTKRSKFSANELHSNIVQALQAVKSDQVSVAFKNKNGEFFASKSSNENDGFVKGSSSKVHVSKDKNGCASMQA